MNNGIKGKEEIPVKDAPFVSIDGFDLCVLCKIKTPYRTSVPFDARDNYTPAGQLCSLHGALAK